ncbi:unnamed protein product [Rhizoctonia solani]|uniref:Uncharacterized protein n=1 Tax=Rhizoctonia solani TaxID=456999 RepID=A0A8H3D6V1_9AGAM|nr:unnamed protein product [Rhizoctonia solani]
MHWFFGKRRSGSSAASWDAGQDKGTERTRRRSIVSTGESLRSSLHPPSPKATSKQNENALAPDPIHYSTATGVPQTPRQTSREAKIEVINNRCRGQPDLEAEIQNLQKTVAEQEAKIRYYQSEPYREEVLSIRRHLRVAEEHEPWWISQKFNEITGRVEDISGEISELLLPLQPTCQPTTHDLFEGLRFPQDASRPSVKHISRYSIRPDEYIDFGCRALINRFLMDYIFNDREFHPSLSSEENRTLCSRYQKIRMQDPQVIAGHWRVSTVKSLGDVHTDHAGISQWLCQCQEVLTPFCRNIYNLESSSQTLDSITPELSELLKLASEWRSFIDLSVVMYDFHPQFLGPGAEFGINEVEIEGIKPNTPPSNKVILTTRLGLLSSRALGESREPESATQSKLGVITSDYFATEG